MKRISEKNNRILWQYILPAFMIVIYGVVLAICYDFYYFNNDDPAMEEILSGLCTGTPDGHTWFHLYPLSWLISRLYAVAPKVHWYGGFLWLCQMGSLYACTIRAIGIWGANKKKYVSGILVFSLFVGMMLPEFVIMTFTVVSGMLGATAVFLMATAGFVKDQNSVIKRGIPSVFFYLFAFCVRREMALLILPFLLISGVYYAFTYSGGEVTKAENGQKLILLWSFMALGGLGLLTVISRVDLLFYVTIFAGALVTLYCIWIECARLGKQVVKFVVLLGVVALACGVTYGIHKAAYSGKEWKDYKTFVEIRSGIYDFGTVPNYGENEEFYNGIGVTEEEASVLGGWNFTLSDKFDLTTMSQIKEYKDGIVSYRYSIYYVKEVMLKAVKQFVGCKDYPYQFLLLGLLGISMICIMVNKNYTRFVILIMIIIGHVGCQSYLLWLGRAPERVTRGLYLAEILLLLSLCLAEMGELTAGKLQVILGGLIAVGVIYAGVNRIQYFNSDTDQSGSYADKQEQARFWQETIKICSKDPEKIYILDTYTYSAYVTPVFGPETITTTNENGVGNVILAGHWIATSPLWYEKLDKLCGASSLQEVYDTGRKCCFLVDSMWLTEKLQSYLTEHYPEMEIVRKDHR